jgi:hypothetical protein
MRMITARVLISMSVTKEQASTFCTDDLIDNFVKLLKEGPCNVIQGFESTKDGFTPHIFIKI